MSRFSLFTDNHVRQQLVDGLRQRGWDVQRAIDAFPENTDDDDLFRYAADNRRVFVTNDDRIRATGEEWLENERTFAGLILWKLEHHRRYSEGWFIEKLEALAEEEAPFLYPIRFINPD